MTMHEKLRWYRGKSAFGHHELLLLHEAVKPPTSVAAIRLVSNAYGMRLWCCLTGSERACHHEALDAALYCIEQRLGITEKC
jgi:hypothetical protein